MRTWDTIAIRRDETDARRLWFEPFGELDFLALPHPVGDIRLGRACVYIRTAADRWFQLRNAEAPDDPQ